MLFAMKSLEKKLNRGAKFQRVQIMYGHSVSAFLQSFPLRENKISTRYRLVQT